MPYLGAPQRKRQRRGDVSCHCERSEAIHEQAHSGLLRRFAPRKDESIFRAAVVTSRPPPFAQCQCWPRIWFQGLRQVARFAWRLKEPVSMSLTAKLYGRKIPGSDAFSN